MDLNSIVGAITALGLPTCLLLYYLWKTDKDKKEYNDKIDKKDEENRAFTNKLFDSMDVKITSLEEERKSDKKIMDTIVDTNKQLTETNKQLADTNTKLHETIINVDNKVETIGKKVDKIEVIVENINK